MEAVKNLSAAAVDVTPRQRDWRETWGEEWESYEVAECRECGKSLVVGPHGEIQHSDVDEGSDCGGYLYAEGPMMNYSYALPGFDMDPGEAAEAIADLPLCLVNFEDESNDEAWALALTGGGMDLTWSIAEAFMRLGYLPPAAYCKLPDYWGDTLTRRRKWILAGCARSLRIVRDRVTYRLRDLKHTREFLKRETARKQEREAA